VLERVLVRAWSESAPVVVAAPGGDACDDQCEV